MVIPKDGEVKLVQIVDADGNPALVALTDVFRLAVQAVIFGPGGTADTRNADADADFAAALIGLVTNDRLSALGAADWQRLEGRGTSASVVDSLFRLLVDSAVRGNNGANYIAIQAATNFAATAAATNRLNVIAAVSGTDTGAAGAQTVVEARNADVDGDFAAALVGLVTNSRLAIRRSQTADFARLDGDILSFANGLSTGAVIGSYAISDLHGTDTTGAAVLRAVEARNADANGDYASTLIGLLTQARLIGLRETGDLSGSTEFVQLAAVEATGSGNIRAYLGTVAARESGYTASIHNRRFLVTHQTAGTEITAQATFVATTPTLLLYNSAGNTSIVILRSITIFIALATANSVKVTVMIDPDDRFSAGGTTVTPQNPNEGSATAYPGTAFRFNATATAADADERIVFNGRIPAGIDQSLEIEFEDAVIINGVGSILVYIYDDAGSVAPTLEFNLDVEAF